MQSVKPPSALALLLGAIPFVAMCFSVPLWDRVEPRIVGLPFNFAWLVGWIVLSPVCLAIAYRIEAARDARDTTPRGDS
jgi:hypothetical protein